MKTTKVYNHETEKHEEIEYEIIGQEFYYRCESNHQIHVIAETDKGLLLRPLGDFSDQLMPGENINGMNKSEAMAHAHNICF